jgi:hypothetical protein
LAQDRQAIITLSELQALAGWNGNVGIGFGSLAQRGEFGLNAA